MWNIFLALECLDTSQYLNDISYKIVLEILILKNKNKYLQRSARNKTFNCVLKNTIVIRNRTKKNIFYKKISKKIR